MSISASLSVFLDPKIMNVERARVKETFRPRQSSRRSPTCKEYMNKGPYLIDERDSLFDATTVGVQRQGGSGRFKAMIKYLMFYII